MKPDAPILHDDLRTDAMGKKGDKPTNVATHMHLRKGQIADGFKQADVVVEREFRTASVHQGYIEPHAAVALWNEDGRLKIWTATQGAFNARQQDGRAAADSRFRKCLVVPCEIGGGFGGKITVYLEPVAALLSRKCGRPVKMTMQRDEVFRRHRSDARLVHARQARREEGRHARRRRGLDGLRHAAAFPAA